MTTALPSWNNTPPKQAILAFVAAVTDENNPHYVPPAERVATFDNDGKPVNIELHIGRPPILVAGNSDGDIEMMEFAEAGGKPCLNLLLHHDDAEREYAYDQGAERALQLAQERDWTVISMKDDLATVFAV